MEISYVKFCLIFCTVEVCQQFDMFIMFKCEYSNWITFLNMAYGWIFILNPVKYKYSVYICYN